MPQYTPQTPDAFLKIGNLNVILEFTTSVSDHENALRKAISLKWAKYMPDLESAVLSENETLAFHVIAVSPSRVASTLHLNDDLINELCLRYRLARSVFTSWGIDSSEEDPQVAQLRHFFSKLNYRSNIDEPTPDRLNARKSIKASYNECFSKVNGAASKTMKDNGEKFATGSCLRLPFLIPKLSDEPSMLLRLPCLSQSSAISVVWSSAISDALNNQWRFAGREPYHHPEHEELLESTEAKDIRHRYRVYPLLTDAQWFHIGMDGVEAKRLKRTSRGFAANLEAKRQDQQRNYSLKADTSDIDKAIDSKWWFENCDVFPMNTNLLFSALSSSVEDSFSINTDEICINLISLSYFYSVVAQQILLAKQKMCKRGEFVLQPVPGYQAFLLVKPTSAEGHIFFSMAAAPMSFMNSTMSPSFASEVCVRSGQTWYISEFQSVRFATLENWIKLPYQLLNSKFVLDEMLGNHPDNYKRLLFPFFCGVSNKSETEEVLTVSRYAYMEMFRIKKNPYKILSKLPEARHSRLTIWAIKKLLRLCDFISSTRTGVLSTNIREEAVEDEDSEISQENVILPAPGMNGDYYITSIDEMLFECYAGYWVNKNQDQDKNQNLKLYKKLFTMNEKLVSDPDCNQRDGVYSGRYHEWSREQLLTVCDHLDNKMTSLMGPNYRSQIEEEFLYALSHTSLDELATLKSSNTSTLDNPYVPRSKVLPEVYKNLDDIGSNMADALDWACKKAKEVGFLINIFKKAQHGGLREISIMNLPSRVVQFSIELLSRILCSKFQEETMTHPSEKNSPVIKHLRKMFGDEQPQDKRWHTFFTSADAEKWNQTLSVSKFEMLLCHVTPPALHGFIRLALSLWTEKDILLDEHTWRTMQDPNFRSRDPTYLEMAQRLQKGLHPFKKDSPFMRIETGMLQGLLHFTSSFFHCAILDTWRSTIYTKVPGIIKISYLVSSDDAGMIYSIQSKKRDGLSKAYQIASWLEAFRCAYLEHAGIRTSYEKSTFISTDVFEFNSIWSLGLCQARASSKFALACTTLADTGTLASRQEQLCSNRQQLLESGVCISTVRKVCFVQGLFYYAMIGAHTHPFFEDYCQRIMQEKDFFSGYFLCDQKMTAGVTTTDYSLWKLCQWTNYGEVLAGALMEEDRAKGITKSGSALLSSHASFVRSKTYQAILKRLENRQVVMEMLNNNPAVLFRKPQTQEELRAALLANYTNSKVVYSLARDRQYEARVFAASAYMISSRCLTLGTAWIEDLFEVETNFIPKVSLLWLSHRQKRRGVYDDEVRRIYFPNVREYERIDELSMELSRAPLVKLNHNLIKNHTRVVVIRQSTDFACTLLNACVWKWGYADPKISNFALEAVWHRFSAMYPWLRDTLEETIKEGNFNNVLQLKETLAHESSRAHVLNVNTCNAYGSSSSLLTYIRNNFARGHRLGRVRDSSIFPDLQHLTTQLAWIQPRPEIQNDLLCSALRDGFTDMSIPESLRAFWIWSTTGNVDDFLNQINPRDITLGGYVFRGQYQKGVYKGFTSWQGTVLGNQCKILCQDEYLISIELDGNPTVYYRIKDELKVLFNDHRWKFKQTQCMSDFAIKPNMHLATLSGQHQCCPITFVSNMNLRANPVRLQKIWLEVSSYNVLRLIGTFSQSSQNEIKLTLAHKWMPSFIREGFNQTIQGGPLGRMINNLPLRWSEFRSLVEKCSSLPATDPTLNMIKNLINVQWLSRRTVLELQTGSTDEIQLLTSDFFFDITDEDIQMFMPEEGEFYEVDDMETQQIEMVQAQLNEESDITNVLRGTEITAEMILNFGSAEQVQRTEYLRLIKILPIDKTGSKFRKDLNKGSTKRPEFVHLAKILGMELELQIFEEDRGEEITFK